jgi:diguanylate cyclase (GGDEF)-like protein
VLTGLTTRAVLMDSLESALGPGEFGSGEVLVLLLDLDGFKAVNDRYGHAAGDRVLEVTAHRLRAGADPLDVVSRIGGDEFAVKLLQARASPPRRPAPSRWPARSVSRSSTRVRCCGCW